MKRSLLEKIITEETSPSAAWRIQQRLNEIDFYDETQEGQVVGGGEGDGRFEAKVQIERDVKHAIIQAMKSGLNIEEAVHTVLRTADEYKGY